MRQVATIPDERVARRLADFLLTLGITSRVDATPAGWMIWVHREDQVANARESIQTFLEKPDDPRFANVSESAKAIRREAQKTDKEHVKSTIRLEGRLNVPSAKRCPITYGLIACSIAIGLWTNLGDDVRATQPFMLSPYAAKVVMTPISRLVEDPEVLPRDGPALIPTLAIRSSGLEPIQRGQVWRLITPIFLHFDILHIAFNMIMLYRLGSLVELRKGHVAMIAIVVICAVSSNLGEYFWEVRQRGPDEVIRFGGMSGVVYALFGYCWMKSDYDPDADIPISSSTVVWMVGWLLLCMTGGLGPVANAAHVVGLGAGIVLGVAPHLLRDRR